ncbi:uncharacterized protein PV06_08803 [Exophiala oligosperma]|uniref:Uncharacterized protein n=1 Tax=Exophiala oligosperma TaxID=215243 RepID=A0A0D2D996_9EURO|nr:uncharacterized protein PV06_08803 [Exophiala oligosperma]KIW38985.1 hypothetical protein PV06_08803 [Exophiala oligosperma]
MEPAKDVTNELTSFPSLPIRPRMPPDTDKNDEFKRLRAELASVKGELDNMKAKARLGDYAGGLFNFIKLHAPKNAQLKGHATTMAKSLED